MPYCLNILITNITLVGYTGTEIFVRDLAIGLKNLGHFPMVYSPQLGGVSQQIIAADIPVVSSLSLLPKLPHIIHGHHHVETMQALMHFPNVPAIFVCHSAQSWHDIPPTFSKVLTYVAVDKNCQERLCHDFEILEADVEVILNWVDTDRFPRRSFLPEKPQRALVFSSYAKANTHLDAVESACEKLQIPLDVIGFGVGKGVTLPEKFLEKYDLIFAKAKCAIEALGTGAAVVLCDVHGLGSMVTSQNISGFRDWNFGQRLLINSITADNIITEINKYSAIDADKVTEFIRKEANLTQALQKYLNLYESTIIKYYNAVQTDFAINFGSYIQNLLQKIHLYELEKKYPFAMDQLSIEACSQLTLTWVDFPKTVTTSCYFQPKVILNNYSQFNLGSFLPYPIYFAYHWLHAETDEILLFEGQRTALNPWLQSQSKQTYQVGINAPSIAGDYRLIVTLVQEKIRWFDALPSPISLSAKIHIVEQL